MEADLAQEIVPLRAFWFKVAHYPNSHSLDTIDLLHSCWAGYALGQTCGVLQ